MIEEEEEEEEEGEVAVSVSRYSSYQVLVSSLALISTCVPQGEVTAAGQGRAFMSTTLFLLRGIFAFVSTLRQESGPPLIVTHDSWLRFPGIWYMCLCVLLFICVFCCGLKRLQIMGK